MNGLLTRGLETFDSRKSFHSFCCARNWIFFSAVVVGQKRVGNGILINQSVITHVGVFES